MRRVLTIDHWASHPDTPAPESFEALELSSGAGLVWQVYVDGQPFIGVPVCAGAEITAREYASQAITTGRYEYVDVRLRPERRAPEDRRLADAGPPPFPGRRSIGQQRRR